jgi:hypothetical protein
LLGVERCLLSAHFREQLLEPVSCQLVGDILRYAPVVRDLLVKFGALVAHVSPLKNRRELNALSVIDSCQGRGDDQLNHLDYVRFPT